MTDSSRKSNGASTAHHDGGVVVNGPRSPGTERAPFGPVAEVIERVADTDVQVILRGEHGTGKELVARAIHSASPRRTRPFIKVDCAAPPQLLEPELFGWDRGSFAGPGQHRPGRLDFAQHGTLFLDHVLDLPAALQLRLQRVLEEGERARAGIRHPLAADVRVMAASDRDLSCAVVEGRFREGLLFHLNGVCLTLSPLRQRRAELRELSEFFVRRYATHYNKPPVPLSHDTIRLFSEYHWPGNLQELETVVNRIVILGSEASVREDLTRAVFEPVAGSIPARGTEGGASGPVNDPARAPDPDMPGTPRLPLKEIARQAADDAERSLIYRTLQRTRWNRREAAARLGVSYKALLYKIKRAETSGAQ